MLFTLQNKRQDWQPSRDSYQGFIYFSCASLGGMVEKWRHHRSCWRSEFLYYYWSQPHHQAGPPLRHCQLYLCCQKHCRQEEKHNRNCHSLWWVNSVCLNLVQVKLQSLILVLEYQVKRPFSVPIAALFLLPMWTVRFLYFSDTHRKPGFGTSSPLSVYRTVKEIHWGI